MSNQSEVQLLGQGDHFLHFDDGFFEYFNDFNLDYYTPDVSLETFNYIPASTSNNHFIDF